MSFNQGWNQGPPARTFRDDHHESRYQNLVRSGTRPGLAQSMISQMEGATLLSSAATSSRQPEFGRDMNSSSRLPPREEPTFRPIPRPATPPPPPNPFTHPFVRALYEEHIGYGIAPWRCEQLIRENWPADLPREEARSTRSAGNPFTHPFMAQTYDRFVGEGLSPERVRRQMLDTWPEHILREDLGSRGAGNFAEGSRPSAPSRSSATYGPSTSSRDHPQIPRPSTTSRPLIPSHDRPAGNPFTEPFLRETYDKYLSTGAAPDRVMQAMRQDYPAHFRMIDDESRPSTSSCDRPSENPFTEPFLNETYDRYITLGLSPDRVVPTMREHYPAYFRMIDEQGAPGSQTSGGYSGGGGGGQGGQYQPAREERRDPGSSQPPPRSSTTSRDLHSRNPFTDPFLRETYDKYIGIGLAPDRVVQVMRENYPAHFRMIDGERAPRVGGQTLGGHSGGGSQGDQYQPPREGGRDRGYSQPPSRDDRRSQGVQHQLPREERGRSSPRSTAPPAQDYTEAEQRMYDTFARFGLQPENAARAVLQQREENGSGS